MVLLLSDASAAFGSILQPFSESTDPPTSTGPSKRARLHPTHDVAANSSLRIAISFGSTAERYRAAAGALKGILQSSHALHRANLYIYCSLQPPAYLESAGAKGTEDETKCLRSCKYCKWNHSGRRFSSRKGNELPLRRGRTRRRPAIRFQRR